MVRDSILRNEEKSSNSRDIEKLKELFPQCFDTDGSFRMETFKDILKDNVNLRDEGYELNFLGKNYARMLASLETTTVIQPDEEHNNKPENRDSKNIYISGDNLDALKHMLKSYEGAVKCIYIDPPYNTGSDGFVYNDKFSFTKEKLMEKLDIGEEEAGRLMGMTSRGSASHSAWLTFMYPRLLLARDLLTRDGVIFISIDDNEQANLKLLCDNVFGEENFINQFTWVVNLTGRQISGVGAAKTYESILCYAKSVDLLDIFSVNVEFAKNNMPSAYLNINRKIEEDEHGKYAIGDTLYNHNRIFNEETRPNLVYSIFYNEITGEITTGNIGEKKDGFTEILPHANGDGVHKYHAWRWSANKVQCESYNLIVLKNKNGYEVYSKKRDFDTTALKDLITNISNGDDEVRALFDDKKVFDYPKSTKLIGLLLEGAGIGKDDIIVDFFSGSATTAHAVMEINARRCSNSNFIMVQIPADIEKDKVAYKAGFRTIDEIGQERIIRAAKKIREENPDTTADLGFKHYILQNFDDSFIDKLDEWYEKLNSPQEILLDEHDHMLNRFGLPTVLTTYMLHDGYGFMSEVQKLDLAGYTAYHCGKHIYLIHDGFGEEQMKALYTVIDTDNGFMAEHIVVFGYSFTYTAGQMLRDNLFKVKDTAGINKTINIDIRY